MITKLSLYPECVRKSLKVLYGLVPSRVVIEVSDQLGRDLEHIFGRAICSDEQAKAYKKHTKAYKSIQKHTKAYKTVGSNQLDQNRADPALSQPCLIEDITAFQNINDF